MCINEEFEEIYQLIDATIDKNIFLIKVSTKETFEVYSINGNRVIRKLGHFNEVYQFVWAKEINRNFIKRRSNFLGLQIKTMTEKYANYLILDSRYKKNAPYFANNDTYLVKGYTSGGCQSQKYENMNTPPHPKLKLVKPIKCRNRYSSEILEIIHGSRPI